MHESLHYPFATRAVALSFPVPRTRAAPVREPPSPVRLRRKTATGQALAATAGTCLGQIAFHAPLVRAHGGIEDVHQMRVAVRRLRAALSAFRRAMPEERLAFEGDLRWLQDKLGAMRDWDVFRQGAVQPVENEESDVALVDEASAKARATAYRELRAALDSARCADLWRAITAWQRRLAHGDVQGGRLDKPIAKYARRELRRRERKLCKRGRRIAELEEEELHKLRIGTKKLRYAAEFFRDLYPKKRLKRALKAMKGLQDLLGTLNDARTARTLLDRLEPRRGNSQLAIAFARGDGVVQGTVLMRAKAERGELERAWGRYAKTRKPWD
jgi:CHAD domain-containing protein